MRVLICVNPKEVFDGDNYQFSTGSFRITTPERLEQQVQYVRECNPDKTIHVYFLNGLHECTLVEQAKYKYNNYLVTDKGEIVPA